MSISTTLDDIDDKFKELYDTMDSDDNFDKNDYPNIITSSDITEIKIEQYEDLKTILIDRSSDLLLWADQLSNYACAAKDAFAKIIDVFVYLRKTNGYNVSNSILIEIYNDVASMKTKIEGKEFDTSYVQKVNLLYENIKNTKATILGIVDLAAQAIEVIDKFKDGMKAISIVGITLSLSDEAISLKKFISSSNHHIEDEPSNTKTINKLEYNKGHLSDVETFPSKLYDLASDKKYYNNIIYTCLSDGRFDEINSNFYKVIKEKDNKKKFKEIDPSNYNILPPFDESNFSTLDNLPNNISDMLNIFIILSQYDLEDEDTRLELKKDIKINIVDPLNEEANSSLSDNYIIEKTEDFYNMFSELQSELTKDTIINTVTFNKQQLDSKSLQYILMNTYRKQSGVCKITPLNDQDIYKLNFTLRDDVILIQTADEKRFQDYLILLYDNMIKSPSPNTFIDKRNNLLSEMNDFLSFKWEENRGKQTIGYFKNNILSAQYGTTYFKYKVFKNLNTVAYGEFSIINKNVQHNVIVMKDIVYYYVDNLYDNYKEDSNILITSHIKGSLKLQFPNIYDGIDNNTTYNFLDLSLTEDIKKIDVFNNKCSMINNIYSNVSDNDYLKLKQDSTVQVIHLNYVFENYIDRYATGSAMIYREQMRAGAINQSEALIKAILKSLTLLNIPSVIKELVTKAKESKLKRIDIPDKAGII